MQITTSNAGLLGRARILVRTGVLAVVGLVAFALLIPTGVAQKRSIDFMQEPACQTLTPTSMGGPAPKNPNAMVLRWLGASNHELAYRNSVILFDAYYQRTPPARPLGFTRDDIKKANAFFIGHGHGDHMADAPDVAQRTGATVTGGPPTAEQARKMGLAEKQVISVGGGEVQKFNGFTVEAILAHHSVRTPEFTKAAGEAYRALQAATGLARTPSEQERERMARQGSSDPRIADQGTIAYLVTFDSGYTLIYLDSSGPVTEGERKVMQRIGGRTDMAIVAYQGFFVAARQIEATLPLVKLFKPAVFMPTHHDETGGSFPDMATYPLFMAIQDELPETRTISPLYKTPICFDLQTKDLYIGEPSAWASSKRRPATQ